MANPENFMRFDWSSPFQCAAVMASVSGKSYNPNDFGFMAMMAQYSAKAKMTLEHWEMLSRAGAMTADVFPEFLRRELIAAWNGTRPLTEKESLTLLMHLGQSA